MSLLGLLVILSCCMERFTFSIKENIPISCTCTYLLSEPYIQYAVSVRVETDGGLSEYSTPNPVITDVAGM